MLCSQEREARSDWMCLLRTILLVQKLSHQSWAVSRWASVGERIPLESWSVFCVGMMH